MFKGEVGMFPWEKTELMGVRESLRKIEISFPCRGLAGTHSRAQSKDCLVKGTLYAHLDRSRVGRDWNGR